MNNNWLFSLAPLFLAPNLAAQLWTERPAAPTPPTRYETAMCFDSARGVTVLFGGRATAGGVLADTWEWNGTTWQQRIVVGPPARFRHAMAYDSVRGRVVLFGGLGTTTLLGDTWEWTGSAWVPVLTTGAPGPRAYNSMVYDSARQRIVLVGRPASLGAGETWEYNGFTATWQLAHSGSPTTWGGGTYEPMAYDPQRQRTTLAVGTGALWSATWEWDGITWIQRYLPFNLPSTQSGGGAMVYDQVAQRLIVVAMQGPGYPAAVWEWDGGPTTGWQQRFPTTSPPIFSGHALAYDSGRGKTVAHGSNLANAWEYESLARLAVVANYGTGCGQPPLQATAYNGSRPLLGTTFLADIAPTLPGAAFMSIGFSNTVYGPFSLPLPLDGFGMIGCFLQNDFAIPLMGCATVSPTTARFSLALPNDYQLLGLKAYLQAAALAPGSNPADLIASNGVQIEIGSF